MEEIDIFTERLKDFSDRKISSAMAKNLEISNVENTTISGYRALGIKQMLRYTPKDDSNYTIGGYNTPIVGP